jgi:hypothetical protein
MRALSSAQHSTWASVLYSRLVIQKKSMAGMDYNACMDLNGGFAYQMPDVLKRAECVISCEG